MTYGIRISDKSGRAVSVKLTDILSEIQDGEKFNWSILFLDCIGNLGQGRSVPVFQEQIRKSNTGVFISWLELNELAIRFELLVDLDLIGSIDKNVIKRYESEEQMYEACDIVIVMFDSCYWEVFSKDKALVEKWEKKFKVVEWLTSKE